MRYPMSEDVRLTAMVRQPLVLDVGYRRWPGLLQHHTMSQPDSFVARIA